jgi:hypothetical protein
MVNMTLEDIYGKADLNLIKLLHPNWEFYRDDQGDLQCRLKSNKKEDSPVKAGVSSG